MSLLLLMAVSCDKFEDGGMHYASSRNIIGTWTYQQVVRNSQPLSDSAFYAVYRNSTIEFEKGSMVHYCWRNASDSLVSTQEGTYVFNYNKKRMSIVFSAYPLDDRVYEVKKLTKDEFCVETVESDSVIYAFTLTKLKQK